MSLSDIVANFGSEGEMNYSIHISPSHRFIYFSNPKSACTTVKASLNLSVARSEGVDLEYKSLGDIHNRGFNLLLNPYQVGYQNFLDYIKDPTFLKICIVRDPVSRLCSSFANKIANNGELAFKVKSYLENTLGEKAPDAISLKDFIKLVHKDDKIRDLDEHWRLQVKQICFTQVPDIWLGRQKHAESDLKMMLLRIFGKEYVYFDAPTFDRKNTSNSKNYMDELDQEDLDNIRTAYAEDLFLLDAANRRYSRADG